MQTAAAMLGAVLLSLLAITVGRSLTAMHLATANALPAAVASARATAQIVAQSNPIVGTTWTATTSAGVQINFIVTSVTPTATTITATMPTLHVTDTFIETANA